MRKEILIAIVSGAVFGLIIAFGIWRANSARSNEEVIGEESEIEIAPEETATPNLSLTLAKPSELEIFTQDSVTVSGITKKDSNLVISGENQDYFLTPDSSGEFEQEVELEPGLNQILVYSFEKDNAISKQSVNVVYSSEFSDFLPETNTETEGTPDPKSIKEKVDDKVNAKLNAPKAYVGTITDKTDTTIQINKFNFQNKNSAGIQQVATDDETEFVKVTTTTKEIEFDEVAIGDFVLAMGFLDETLATNETGVLNAKRILMISPVQIRSTKVVFGKIDSIEGKIVTLAGFDQKEYTLTFPKNWDGPDLDELEEGQSLFAIGEEKDDEIEIRTIEIAKETGTTSPSPTPTE